MKFKLSLLALPGALLLLAGCNLFNPNGTGTVSDDGLIPTGEELFREGKYAEAMSTFAKAIKQDSTQSMAYYGYAKAAVRLNDLDNLGILNDLDSTKNDTASHKIFFQDHDDALLTRRLQASFEVQKILTLLSDRDTLTRFYGYLSDSGSVKAQAKDSASDTAYVRHKNFIRAYLAQSDLGTPGYRPRSQFPLMDRRMTFENIRLDFTAFSTVYALTSACDFDGNGVIDFEHSNDSLFKKFTFSSTGSIDSLSTLLTSINSDTVAQQQFNTLVQKIQSNLSNASNLVASLGLTLPGGGGGGSDSSDSSKGVSSKTGDDINKVISGLGDALSFYQLNDKKDNDGDGCIDEEIIDSKDNDGDGYVDEDVRSNVALLPDIIDNDHNGVVNEPAEDSVGSTVNPSSPQLLGFVNNFYVAHPDSAGMWVKIKQGDANLAYRIRVQKDSLTLKSNADLTGALKSKLDSAKALIGGCWRNYP